MFPNFKFHHIGVAVFSIEKTAKVYAVGGYTASVTVFDPIQNVNICFLHKENMPTVELLEPVDEHSPVVATLKKSGVTPYHTCYEVENMDEATATLRQNKFLPVGKRAAAVAFGGRNVQFFFHKDVGLIEIVEAI
ncbi:MAG: VOC family protein [Sodaliphilus sp.]